MEQAPRATLRVAIAGVCVVVAYAVLAAVQIFVLNPLAAVPGVALNEIYAEMDAAGEGNGWIFAVVVLAGACVLAVALAVAVLRARMGPEGAAMMFLAFLVGGAPTYFMASFGPGMGLADTFGVSGGDHSGWGALFYGVSLLALVTLVALAIRRALLGRQPAAARGQ